MVQEDRPLGEILDKKMEALLARGQEFILQNLHDFKTQISPEVFHLWALEAELLEFPEDPARGLEIMRELLEAYQQTGEKPTRPILEAIKTIGRWMEEGLIDKAREKLASRDNPQIIDKRKVRDLLIDCRTEYVDSLIERARKGGMKFELEGKVRTLDPRFGK